MLVVCFAFNEQKLLNESSCILRYMHCTVQDTTFTHSLTLAVMSLPLLAAPAGPSYSSNSRRRVRWSFLALLGVH
jgi:hypothetical protein